jgi:hypothetical protein
MMFANAQAYLVWPIGQRGSAGTAFGTARVFASIA